MLDFQLLFPSPLLKQLEFVQKGPTVPKQNLTYLAKICTD